MGEITKLLETARNYIGAKEGTKKYSELIEAFESNKKYPYDGQGCCEVACAIFIIAFGMKRAKQLIPIINYANGQSKLWKDGLQKTPKVGALVYFNDPIDHVELVTNIGINEMTTIDGNSNHTVIERVRKLKDETITGYGIPDFKEDKDFIVQEWQEAVIRSVQLKRYATGDLVLWLQKYLQQHGYYKEGYLDGIFGTVLEAAVRDWQRDNGLLVDGIIGRFCWTYMLK